MANAPKLGVSLFIIHSSDALRSTLSVAMGEKERGSRFHTAGSSPPLARGRGGGGGWWKVLPLPFPFPFP